MRYFFDTEFIDDGKTIELISIGMVCEDGRELYLVSNEFDESRCDEWLHKNVLNQLPPRDAMLIGSVSAVTETYNKAYAAALGPVWRSRAQIRDAIRDFVVDEGNGVKAEFIAYFASYDWVVLAQLFGKMIDLPKHFTWLVHDLRTWATDHGFTGKFKELLPDTGHHDALADARWNRDAYNVLTARFAAAVDLVKVAEAIKPHSGPVFARPPSGAENASDDATMEAYLKVQAEGLKATLDDNARAIAIADKLLADLNDRAGFAVGEDARQMIRPDWVKLITEAL